MQQASLDQIIKLINRTGDRIVVIDKNAASTFVVMGIRDYERLVLTRDKVKDLTENELLNKINRDVAIWKASQEEEENEEEISFIDNNFDELLEDEYYFEPLED